MTAGTDTITAELFKAAFRGHPAGVAIVSAAGDGGPAGLTVSSVASVSVAPPAVSFSLADTASARVVLAAATFVVQLLGPRHAGLADDFAKPGRPRFTAAQGWQRLPTGEPFLPDAPVALRCAPLHLIPVGVSSTLVVAEVLDVVRGRTGGALVYRDRRYTAMQ